MVELVRSCQVDLIFSSEFARILFSGRLQCIRPSRVLAIRRHEFGSIIRHYAKIIPLQKVHNHMIVQDVLVTMDNHAYNVISRIRRELRHCNQEFLSQITRDDLLLIGLLAIGAADLFDLFSHEKFLYFV